MSQRMNPCELVLGLLAWAIVFTHSPAQAREAWSLDTSGVLPERISLTVRQRTRYERLDDQFRRGVFGDSDVIVLRTLVHGRIRLLDGLWIGGELEDSRAERTGDTLLDTSIVNAVEALRAYLEFEKPDVRGGTLAGQFGRITMDIGSRRFVARNRFRNTINGFTGLDLSWTGADGSVLRAFYVLPVRRLPTDRDRLEHNDIRNDEESFASQFWGLFASAELPGVGRGELFWFGLHERDRPSRGTQHLELYTPGFRVLRAPEKGRWDYQIENAFQFGNSRAQTGGRRLDHFAHFHHAEVGYTFDAAWTPRLALQYDYASGDDKPNDDEADDFDTLFGARRFDFGPTGIYGPFARQNLNTPGIRLQIKPAATVSSFLAFRGYWLADKRDAWVAANVSDPTGNSGSFIGSQLELRVRWSLLPQNVMLETGFAYLFAGEFIDDAPTSNDEGDSNYFYTQLSVNF